MSESTNVFDEVYHLREDNAQLRADNARKDAEIVRLKSEAEKAKQERNAEGVRQRNIYLPQLHARDKALVEAVCALSKWHALLKKLKTGYDDNSLDVLDQIGATTLESENTIAHLNSLLGDKCGVATPKP